MPVSHANKNLEAIAVHTWGVADGPPSFWLRASANRFLIIGSAALRHCAKCFLVSDVRDGAASGLSQCGNMLIRAAEVKSAKVYCHEPVKNSGLRPRMNPCQREKSAQGWRCSQSSTPDRTRLAALLTILMHERYTATSQVAPGSGFQLEANAAAISRYKSSLNVGNFRVICRLTTDRWIGLRNTSGREVYRLASCSQ